MAWVVVTVPAQAGPGPSASALMVEAFPLFGTSSTMAQGWNEINVRIQNGGVHAARGHVEALMQSFGHDALAFHATAPFSVAAGAAINLRVPAEIGLYGDLVVRVLDADRLLHEEHFSSFAGQDVTLLDISEASPLRAAIHEAAIMPLSGASSSRGDTKLTVVLPHFDPVTGDPILPDRAALYTTVDAVLIQSERLMRLTGAELDALAGYVLAGGTLALTVTRPEDLRAPAMMALAGGLVTPQGVSSATLQVFSPDLSAAASNPDSSTKRIESPGQAQVEVVSTLSGHSGGNLHDSLYGASASYGLGEVHLLAFDPTRKPGVDDPWVQARVVDLVRRAYDRKSTQVFRPGAELYNGTYAKVRQLLDPNEGSRWAIGATTLLLCLYAVIAGPLNFSLASKAKMPMRALRRMPFFAAVAFAWVVGIGVAARGVAGRARHLTLVETGAGMTKGAARRFRGFYASQARELTVRTSDNSSLVSMAVLAEYADRKNHLMVDRDGARLIEVAAPPWQTVVVREDGFVSLGEGVALVRDGEAGLTIINRTGHDLRAVILRTSSGDFYYFPHLHDGGLASLEAGQKLAGSTRWEHLVSSPFHVGVLEIHRLSAEALGPVVDRDAPGLSDAWSAIEDASGERCDWFPAGVPTLIAQIDGGEGRGSDSGLPLESDRLLLRVVGEGGRP